MSTVILVFLLVYAFVLCLGTWMAIGTLWRKHFPRVTAWFIAIGMVMFFLCDNSLGRFEAFRESAPLAEKNSFIVFESSFKYTYAKIEGDTITVFAKGKDMKSMTIPHTLKTICGFLVWFFYLPSQVLLMLSAFKLSFLSSVFGLIKPPKGKQAVVYRT